jgi:hypothetical protein
MTPSTSPMRTKSRIGEDEGFCQALKDLELPSCYKVASIARACAVVRSRKKGAERPVEIGHPRPHRPMVCFVSRFFITMKGGLLIQR